MRAVHYKKSATPSHENIPQNPYVAEALAKQAAIRPPRTPPREMPVTPTLPRQPKPLKRRKYSM
jgi:hypothetical protein